MKYLVVYAHPNDRSFNHAIKEEIEANLKKNGKEYFTRDLYAIGFKPVLESADFIAMSKGNQLADIETEQKYVKEADVLILIHPIWWFNMPAILKGYVDRVFSRKFAYDYTEKGLVGLLAGKSVIIFNTTGGPAEDYENSGFKSALKSTIDQGVFGFCGMNVKLHKFFYAIPTSTEVQRKSILNEIGNMEL